jgi:predicted Zn-dependent protease
LQLRGEDLNKRVTPEEYLKGLLKVRNLKSEGPIQGTTLPSYSGVTPLNTPFGRRDARVSVVFLDNRAFLFLAAAKNDAAFAKHEGQFLSAARTLHALKPEEKQIAEGLKLRVVRAGKGETFANLAAKSPVTNYAESVLRLINNKFPAGEPAPGEAIKTIQ